MISVFLWLTSLRMTIFRLLHMALFHSFLWQSNSPLYMYVPLLFPFLCQWTCRCLPCLGYFKQCCSEHWGVYIHLRLFLSVILISLPFLPAKSGHLNYSPFSHLGFLAIVSHHTCWVGTSEQDMIVLLFPWDKLVLEKITVSAECHVSSGSSVGPSHPYISPKSAPYPVIFRDGTKLEHSLYIPC